MFYKISQSFTPKHQQPAFGTKLPNAKNKVFFLFLFFSFFSKKFWRILFLIDFNWSKYTTIWCQSYLLVSQMDPLPANLCDVINE